MKNNRLDRLGGIDIRSAERFRLTAYLLFFASLAVLLLGLVPAMYYGSAGWVFISLLVAGALFFAAFFAGGVGWSRFNTTNVTREQTVSSHDEFGLQPPPRVPMEPEQTFAQPPPPPLPSDESRPPR